jgi:dihydrofolate synthase/folylpolyglutamate synthase
MSSRSILMSPAPTMTYDEALAFWFGRINYEQRTPLPADLKLDRMKALLALLDNPQDKLRIIHVAGSKGKGSCSAMLESILRQAGYRTGLFTSPHLCHVEERVQVDGVQISPVDLTAMMTEIREAIGKMENVTPESPISGQAVTFFEVATALGFLYFAHRKVDVAVIEVGLGGRFDSTNVCQPLASVITSISFDHTQQLGNRLDSIAMEKAGIVKPGHPTISGVTAPEARQVIDAICQERHSTLLQIGRDFHFEYEPGKVGKSEIGSQRPEFRGQGSGVRNQESGVKSQNKGPSVWSILRQPKVRITAGVRAWPAMELGLWGKHQAANAAVAVACVEELGQLGMRIDDAAVHAGLAKVRWPARMEILGLEPIVILDCAHNVASAHALVETLLTSFSRRWSDYPTGRNSRFEAPLSRIQRKESQFQNQKGGEVSNLGESASGFRVSDLPPRGFLDKRLLIFAGSSDKDLEGMLEVLTPPFDHVFVTRYSHSPRAVPAEQLGDLLIKQRRVPFTICSTPAEAWASARTMAGPDDLICLTGSVFLAGELRPLLIRNCAC